MAEYNNKKGWEASERTRNYWRYIPMQSSKNQVFEMPPLFKSVNPIIKWMIIGFVSILGIEAYATFAVAMKEGVPIEVIGILILVDIFLAVLPHMIDGKRIDLKNFIFIGDNDEEYLKIEVGSEQKYKANLIKNEDKLKSLNIYRILLYIPIVISTFAKLYLFFSQYPFFNTYQAYIVIISYTLGCILHILCTGNVIMYWRFRRSLKIDRKKFGASNSETNKIDFSRPERLINTKDNITFNIHEHDNSKQKIVIKGGKYYFHYEGLLFDEEINLIIGDHDNPKQMYAIALTGKLIQTNLLTKTGDSK